VVEATSSTKPIVPRVSVVIPSYNHARFIGEAIDSVLSQSMSSLELIVIDDGSRDDSVNIAAARAADDERVRVIRQKNAGSHGAINRGLKLARGSWLAILNSDDIWEPTRLEQMLAQAEQDNAQFLFSDVSLIDADGKLIDDPAHWWNFSVKRLRERVRAEGVQTGLLYGNLTVSTSNFLFRRDVLDTVGRFRRFRYNLDWDYALRCLDADHVGVAFVDAPLLRYRLHGDNAILSGMPGAAAEAQLITRQVYRRRLHAPESLLLSHHRHDRLLRRYLQLQVRQEKESCAAIEKDRDALAELINQRQTMIDAERRHAEAVQNEFRNELVQRDQALADASTAHMVALSAANTAHMEVQAELQFRLQEQMSQREVAERLHTATYLSSVRARAERDFQRCREVRMLQHLEGRDLPGAPALPLSRSLLQRAMRAIRSSRRINESIAFLRGEMPPGAIRTVPRGDMPVAAMDHVVAAHLHIYYLDLASELISDVLRVPALTRVIITGPWEREDFAGALDVLVGRGIDVKVIVVPNRGKDVGGLLAAIREGGLLDSDLVIKLHSKKSHNPASYFQAISALFGQEIADGNQWRRALITPLAGDDRRVENVTRIFQNDPAVGMVGARPFITRAPDANAALSAAVYERFNAPQGEAFVAGTMFWIRSSLLKPLLDENLDISEFSLDSREVEGGLEHVMERMLGALVIGRGFDIYGVEA